MERWALAFPSAPLDSTGVRDRASDARSRVTWSQLRAGTASLLVCRGGWAAENRAKPPSPSAPTKPYRHEA